MTPQHSLQGGSAYDWPGKAPEEGFKPMLGFLLGLVTYVVIPIIMITGLVLAFAIARNTKDDGGRVAAYAGLLAGLVAGSGFAVTQIRRPAIEGVTEGVFQFNPFAVVIGVVIGFGLPYIVLFLPEKPRLVGVLTLVLSAASSLATFNYLFSGATRDFTMLLAMSLLFGVLVYLVFNGEKLKEIREVFRGDVGEGAPGAVS